LLIVESSWFIVENIIMKTIYLVRHGDIPGDEYYYNVDEVTKPEDIKHLTELGKKQIKDTGLRIKDEGENIIKIVSSPAQRTRETAEILKSILFADISIDKRLNETYAPGPYLEKIVKTDPIVHKGFFYDKRWAKYKHETIEDVGLRMKEIFDETTKVLKDGEAEILVSHGDPIAILFRYLMTNKFPIPDNVHLKPYYLEKGEAIMILISEKGKYDYKFFMNSSIG